MCSKLDHLMGELTLTRRTAPCPGLGHPSLTFPPRPHSARELRFTLPETRDSSSHVTQTS